MFKLKTNKTIGQIVTGMFMSPIKYEVRVESGNWNYPISYFGHYQNQKWGQWDSNSCWCLSAVNCVEDQLEWLNKQGMFTTEAMEFFIKYGYIDADGDFSLSERFIEVLGGYKSAGANQMEAWKFFQMYGMIPRDMLTYTVEQSNKFADRKSFDADYFNPLVVTREMRLLGQQFLKHVNIARQWIGTNWETPDIQVLQAALKQAPVQIGIPVPNYWNQTLIIWDGTTSRADHAVQLYGIDAQGRYLIFDQYKPNLKTLSANYFIPIVCQGIVSAVPAVAKNPVVQDTLVNKIWTAVMNYFNGIVVRRPVGIQA